MVGRKGRGCLGKEWLVGMGGGVPVKKIWPAGGEWGGWGEEWLASGSCNIALVNAGGEHAGSHFTGAIQKQSWGVM